MAEIRCPKCGRNNPDTLDVCQFCQTPLKPESVLRIGQTPTRKNTGELESVLPEWLKDVRQQARDSAQEEAAQAAAHPAPKNEPPDLLAGLASQTGSGDEEEVPDWLANIRSAAKPESPSTPAPEKDFFAQFNREESKPASEPAQEETPAWLDRKTAPPPPAEEKDELSEWFSRTAEKPEETVEFDSEPGLDASWGSNFDSPLPPKEKEPAPKEEEDLGWLRNLEEVAKKTGDLKAPKQGSDWMADFEKPVTPSEPSAKEDLGWLDRLGGIEEPSQQPFEQPAAPKEDLSWLNQFGGTAASEPFEATEKPSAPKEDLSWLNNLGAESEPPQPFDAAPDKPISSEPIASEDLSWLNNLGGTPEPAQPFSAPEAGGKPFSGEDLSWLNDLGSASEQPPPFDTAPSLPTQEEPSWLKDLGGEAEPLSTPPFVDTGSLKDLKEGTPRQTAPLGEKSDQEETEPDWLKSATEAPSMPAPGDFSMDWFTNKEPPAEEKPPVSTPPASPFSELGATPGEPPPLSNQDVDSLFSMEMPDWLSRPEPAADETTSKPAATPVTDSEGSLSPVELPSWVQAMRPVEAMISETAPSVEDQPEEMEGPLAGLRGVIPGAPIGSAKRPKAVSLTLQASSEQQAGAALLEQILGSETSPRALVAAPVIASQQVLRWGLTALFLVVLGAMIFLRSQSMPVSQAPLPAEMQLASDAVANLPDNSRVLVVVDYEPSLAGEMEAVGGPFLTDLVSRHHPTLAFLSTSPMGPGLVERLLNDTTISKPDGFAYQSGTQYFNLGYLPGGSAGVLGFVESPSTIIPDAGVASLSEYSALIVMTDHAESGRVWVEQLQNRKQFDPALAGQPLLVVASAQAGPLLQPYVASRQINGILTGLSEAVRYETAKSTPNRIAGSYWDTFGIGLAMSIALIVIGSLWSVLAGIRARRAEAQ